jgi:hypothetical protein
MWAVNERTTQLVEEESKERTFRAKSTSELQGDIRG